MIFRELFICLYLIYVLQFNQHVSHVADILMMSESAVNWWSAPCYFILACQNRLGLTVCLHCYTFSNEQFSNCLRKIQKQQTSIQLVFLYCSWVVSKFLSAHKRRPKRGMGGSEDLKSAPETIFSSETYVWGKTLTTERGREAIEHNRAPGGSWVTQKLKYVNEYLVQL